LNLLNLYIFIYLYHLSCLTYIFFTEKNNKLMLRRAEEVAKLSCCINMCLRNKMLYDDSIIFARGCLSMVEGLSKPDKKDFIRNKIQECVVKTSQEGYFKYNWIIGQNPGVIFNGCCRNIFMACYDIKKDYLERYLILVNIFCMLIKYFLADWLLKLRQALSNHRQICVIAQLLIKRS